MSSLSDEVPLQLLTFQLKNLFSLKKKKLMVILLVGSE